MAGLRHTSRVAERFLRQLWKHQHFTTTHLQSTDGRQIDILSPGFLNHDGGPDFRGALVRIGGTLFRGDIELHNTADEWFTHGHGTDPHYTGVILHVVLVLSTPAVPPTVTRNSRNVPVLVLSPSLGSSFRDAWDTMITDERSERRQTLPCANRSASLSTGVIRHWLEHLATERLEIKLRRFEERLKELIEDERRELREPVLEYPDIPFGLNPEDLPPPVPAFAPSDFSKVRLWEQVVYEGALEALGYSKNRTPFLALARNLPLRKLSILRDAAPSFPAIDLFEAFLFGVAGLLGAEQGFEDVAGREKFKHLSDLWTKYRSLYRREVLHEADWQFFRLRPENFPTIRIAGAARIALAIIDGACFRTIVSIISGDESAGVKVRRLVNLFIVRSDGFWLSHYTFRSPAPVRVQRLVGRSRAFEIVLNTVLPLTLLYARIFRLRDVRENVLRLYEALEQSGGNSVVALMTRQVFRDRFTIRHAWEQQGMLQLYNYYCSEGRCAECTIGARLGLSSGTDAGGRQIV